jgi:hypothetical protein
VVTNPQDEISKKQDQTDAQIGEAVIEVHRRISAESPPRPKQAMMQRTAIERR